MQVAREQVRKQRKFLVEHPQTASPWKLETTALLLEEDGVDFCGVDMCAFGLRVSERGLSRKRTRLLLNDSHMHQKLLSFQCTRDHVHVPLESGLPKKAAIFPPRFHCNLTEGVPMARKKSEKPESSVICHSSRFSRIS